MRPIDADAFLKDILTAGIGKTIIEYSESDIGYMIRKRPTVDAVPVVRCKDCVFYDHLDCYMNELTRPDDFCSHGVRKDDHHVDDR